jgi:hypothetical protein
MGMDFVALMKYAGPGKRLWRALTRLEAGSPEEIQALAQLMHERVFTGGHHDAAVWSCKARPELRDPTLDCRPALPNVGIALRLPEDFFLTFGHDAVEAYHLLRWHLFLTEPDLQRAMLDACLCLARLFAATDCVLTSDYSPVVHAFREGKGFDESLASAGPEDGERPSLTDLYLEVPVGEVMRFIDRPGKPRQTRHMAWEVDRPPPEGWQRLTAWDSKGYWRLDLAGQTPSQVETMALPAVEPARATGEQGWQTSGEPNAMLDLLLKRDAASWRKMLLWACACLRRTWPRLATEPVRRAVEVAERFADGLADQQTIEKAERATGSVRKGDRQANHAAWLLARLCSARLLPIGIGEGREKRKGGRRATARSRSNREAWGFRPGCRKKACSPA